MSKTMNLMPSDVQSMLDAGEITLIDVREPAEYDALHIPGAILMPLSGLDPACIPADPAKPVVLHCKSGGRSGMALDKCRDAGVAVLGHVKGGIEAWRAQGLPVIAKDGKTTGLSVSQAVMALGAGMNLISITLGYFVNPAWLLLGAGVSTMLLQASFTGFCPAGRVFSALGFRPG